MPGNEQLQISSPPIWRKITSSKVILSQHDLVTSLPWSHLQHPPSPKIYGPLECWEITSWSMGRWRGFPRSGLELDFYLAGRWTGLSGGWSRSGPLSIAVRADQPQTWLTKPQHSISKSPRSRLQSGTWEKRWIKLKPISFPPWPWYWLTGLQKNRCSWAYHLFVIPFVCNLWGPES